MTGWLFKARAALFSIEQLAADQLQSKLAKLADQTVNETGSVPSRSEKKGRGNIFWRAGRGSVLSLVQLSNQRAVHLTKFILCSAICYLRRQIIYFQRSLQL
ncbi:Acetolactate synthase small subunit 2,chloroplastic [Trichinella pseudospiralis]